MRNDEILVLCFCAVIICQLFFIVLLYFTQYAMKFLGNDPMWADARVVQFMLSYGVVSYFGGVLYGFLSARRLILGGSRLCGRGECAAWNQSGAQRAHRRVQRATARKENRSTRSMVRAAATITSWDASYGSA